MLQIIVRKVYHLLAGGLFVPVFFWDLQLLCLSLGIAFAVLVLLEVVRRLQLPGLGQAVQRFMQVGLGMVPQVVQCPCVCFSLGECAFSELYVIFGGRTSLLLHCLAPSSATGCANLHCRLRLLSAALAGEVRTCRACFAFLD